MEQNSSKAAFISYPFYIFISLLIGAIAVIAIRDLWNSSSLIYTAIFSLLFLLHIALFWSNTRQDENSRWWFFFYPAQVVLIVAMVNQPFASDINLTLLGSSILCLIAVLFFLFGDVVLHEVQFFLELFVLRVFVLEILLELDLFLLELFEFSF